MFLLCCLNCLSHCFKHFPTQFCVIVAVVAFVFIFFFSLCLPFLCRYLFGFLGRLPLLNGIFMLNWRQIWQPMRRSTEHGPFPPNKEACVGWAGQGRASELANATKRVQIKFLTRDNAGEKLEGRGG